MKSHSITRALICVAFFTSLCACLAAQERGRAAGYAPSAVPNGGIRSWGDDAMKATMAAWESAFRRYHPEVTFTDTLYGSGTGMAGIITGASDLSLMGRPVDTNEIIGFEWVHRYKPLQIRVLTGSLSADERSPALAVVVSAKNPLREISMEQLTAILACDDHGMPTWAQAGAHGPSGAKHIHVYLPDSETGTGAFLQQAILKSGDRWNWAAVHEFKDRKRKDGSIEPAGQQIAEALRKDVNGLAITSLSHLGPGLRALALSSGGAAIVLTRASLESGTYPLSRGVYIDISRKPGTPIEPRIREFLRFILSPEGQQVAKEQGDFIPLSTHFAAEQAAALEDAKP